MGFLLARRSSFGAMHLVFSILGAAILLFLGVPLAKMILSSSPMTLWQAITDSQVKNSIILTFYTSLLATLVGVVLGVPLAYLLARQEFRGKRLVEGLIDIPVVVPHSVVGIALLFVFGRGFLVGRAFHALRTDFVGEIAGIVIAMLFVSLPFLVNAAKEGFRSVDVRLENVSRTLGVSDWQTFVRVSLPLSWTSILSGSVMMWARGISEFGAVLILAYHPMIAPILVFERFESYGLDYARPVAVLLILTCLAAFVVLRTVAQRGGLQRSIR